MRQSWARRRISVSSSRAPQRRKRSKSRVLEIPSGKIVGWTAQAIAPGGRKGWPSASPRTFAWSTRAHHERQQTISHRRYFVACRGRDWPLKTASTFAVRAREARPSGGETRILFDPIQPQMLQTMRVKRLIRFGNKTLEILDRIELAEIAGFDPTTSRVGAREVQPSAK